jgi:hypothetical protein
LGEEIAVETEDWEKSFLWKLKIGREQTAVQIED